MSDSIQRGFEEGKGAVQGDMQRDTSRIVGSAMGESVEKKVRHFMQNLRNNKDKEQKPIIETANRILNSGVAKVELAAPSIAAKSKGVAQQVLSYKGVLDPKVREAISSSMDNVRQRIATVVNTPKIESQNDQTASQDIDRIPEAQDARMKSLYGAAEAYDDIQNKLEDSSVISDTSRTVLDDDVTLDRPIETYEDAPTLDDQPVDPSSTPTVLEGGLASDRSMEAPLVDNTTRLQDTSRYPSTPQMEGSLGEEVSEEVVEQPPIQTVTAVADTVLEVGGTQKSEEPDLEQKKIVEVTENVAGYRETQASPHTSLNTDVDLFEPGTQRRYDGDELSIIRTGNVVEIHQNNELVFKYEYEKGRPKVSVDKITGGKNPYLEKKFNNIHNRMVAAAPVPEHRPAWVRQVLSDETGQSQVTNLGPLAPRGSKAIATAKMLTTEELPTRTVTDGKSVYSYHRTSTKDENGNLQTGLMVMKDTDGKGSRHIVARSTGKGIEGGRQTAQDYSDIQKHYAKSREIVMSRVKERIQANVRAGAGNAKDTGGR